MLRRRRALPDRSATTEFRLSFVGVDPVAGPPFHDLDSWCATNSAMKPLVLSLTGLGVTEQELHALGSDEGGLSPEAVSRFLREAYRHNLLQFTLMSASTPLATVVPSTEGFRPFSPTRVPEGRYQLSRFALMRGDGARLLFECPLSPAYVVLHDRNAALPITQLHSPVTVDEAVACLPGDVAPIARMLIGLLRDLRMITAVDASGVSQEDRSATLLPWEFADLLFHARSRVGRHRQRYGETNRFRGRLPQPPAIKPVESTDRITLPRADIQALRRHDLPFTEVLESRRSVRGSEQTAPVTLDELGKFLYRCARAREIRETAAGTATSRPYPSGGALYPLEVYLAARECDGLAPGLYHYDPVGHELGSVAPAKDDVEALMEAAASAQGSSLPPQLLLILSARFARVSWKYESIAYSLILKEVGVLLQTMCLVATAMGLSACPLACGDSDRFARVANTEYYTETSVGELTLNGRSVPSDNPSSGGST